MKNRAGLAITPPGGIIFIAGLDLSGSTVVDLGLGSLPGVVGLGEVDNVIVSEKRLLGEGKNGPIEKNECTCGVPAESCAIWGRVLRFIREQPDSAYQDRYSVLLSAVKKTYPSATWCVDSSKEEVALRRLLELQASSHSSIEKVTAILVRRSPLDWLISDTRRAARRGRRRTFRISLRRIQKWAHRYQSLNASLESSGIEVVRINLKRFQNNPGILTSLLQRSVADFNPLDVPIRLSSTRSHVIWGSHHRLNPHKRTQIIPKGKYKLLDFVKNLPPVLSSPACWVVNFQLWVLEIRSERSKR